MKSYSCVALYRISQREKKPKILPLWVSCHFLRSLLFWEDVQWSSNGTSVCISLGCLVRSQTRKELFLETCIEASFVWFLRNSNHLIKSETSDIGRWEWVRVKNDFEGQIRGGVETLGFSQGKRVTGKRPPKQFLSQCVEQEGCWESLYSRDPHLKILGQRINFSRFIFIWAPPHTFKYKTLFGKILLYQRERIFQSNKKISRGGGKGELPNPEMWPRS